MQAPAEAQNAAAAAGPGLGLQHTDFGNPAEVLWNLIIRPPRSRYSPEEHLGPKHFRLGADRRTNVRRSDVRLRNPRGHYLECSWFESLPLEQWQYSREQEQAEEAAAAWSNFAAAAGGHDMSDGGCASRTFAPWPRSWASSNAGQALQEAGAQQPCIVFLHGNSSCRLEAIPLLPLLMPLSISLFCFDFSGCGLSEGDYISLGWYERDDLAQCIDFLRASGRVSTIALWGRSMGAFTALLHADRDPSIAGLVLDSPFTSLQVVVEELARGYAKVPTWMVRAVLKVVRGVIQSKANFDIEDLHASEHAGKSFSPAMFIAADGDDFILPHHANELHEAYQGEKELVMVEGDHNSARPEACKRKAVLFLCRALHDARLNHLLGLHSSGLYDIFDGLGVQHQQLPPSSLRGRSQTPTARFSEEDRDHEGAAICQRMQVFPTLRQMMLIERRSCQRPFFARTELKLLHERAEAGFFVRLDSAVEDGALLSGACSQQLLVLTVSVAAVMISKVCDDSLQTVAVAAGVPLRRACDMELSIDLSGKLIWSVVDQVLHVDCGAPLRAEAAVWLMLLVGQTTFGDFIVEDAEATLRENLGDLCLKQRHLGSSLSAMLPAQLPLGDTLPLSCGAPRCAGFASGGTEATLESEVAEGSTTEIRTASACRPEALVGWRLRLLQAPHGEAVVVGVHRRFGRATQHVLARPGSGGDSSDAVRVVLCRKDAQRLRRRGVEFDILRREF